MPGNNVRQASKNVSRSKRSALAKNNNRVEAAIRGTLEDCTYGRITKTLGNKTFLLLDANKREHQGHIRGKMARIGVDDIVLLSKREYESRASTDKAIYDIVAVFERKDAAYLIKQGEMPKWMLAMSSEEGEDGDIFEYGEENGGEYDITIKRREIDLDNEDLDIDNI
jgi:translation initiation factor IF-1